MSDVSAKRFTDCTPDEMGDVARFVINVKGTGQWAAFAYWAATDSEKYGADGYGSGATIEEAIAAAIESLNGDEFDDPDDRYGD